jgi:glycosyltransferase involved in cell wall biosynthesis
MKIAYITGDDPHSMSGWSGLTYFIGKALRDAGNELSYINSFHINTGLILKLKQKVYPKLTGKFIQPNRYPSIIHQYTKQLSQKLNWVDEPDFIFSNSSEIIAAAQTNTPAAFWVDASFAGMMEYYPEFSILHPETIEKANQLEQKAYNNARLIFFASDWAAETALKNYTIDEKKVKVVPFGANIIESPLKEEVFECIKNRSNTVCHLIFIGVYWERKGGPTAVAVTQELIRAGINAKLTIVGCSPFDENNKPEFVTQTGFLSKTIPSERTVLENLLKQSHFMIMTPSAECYGLVYCEANAYGVPVLATNTGGISTIVKEDINGKLFDMTDKQDHYSEYIQRYWKDFEQYKALAERSFEQFEQRLNWHIAGKTVSEYMNEAIYRP